MQSAPSGMPVVLDLEEEDESSFSGSSEEERSRRSSSLLLQQQQAAAGQDGGGDTAAAAAAGGGAEDTGAHDTDSGAADEQLADNDDEDEEERPASKARARDALLRVMEDLDIDHLLVESSVRSAVCLTARDDRFIGAKSNEKIAVALRRMTTDASGFHREDVDGGHLQLSLIHI